MSLDSRPAPKTGANAWVALQVDESKFLPVSLKISSSYSQPPSFREGEIPNFKEKSGIWTESGKIKPVSLTKVKNNDDHRAA